jgi:hypothetical protein
MSPDWIPGKSVGPFIFEQEIGLNAEKYRLSICKPDPETDSENYVGFETPDRNLMIGTRNGNIAVVHVFHSLYYQGRELLGLTPQVLKRILAVFDWKEDNKAGPSIVVLKSESLGAMFFVEQGLVDSAILSPLE